MTEIKFEVYERVPVEEAFWWKIDSRDKMNIAEFVAEQAEARGSDVRIVKAVTERETLHEHLASRTKETP